MGDLSFQHHLLVGNIVRLVAAGGDRQIIFTDGHLLEAKISLRIAYRLLVSWIGLQLNARIGQGLGAFRDDNADPRSRWGFQDRKECGEAEKGGNKEDAKNSFALKASP